MLEVLKRSKHMNSPIGQRGKGSMTHSKGKRKWKQFYRYIIEGTLPLNIG